jgi:hypothetical protein
LPLAFLAKSFADDCLSRDAEVATHKFRSWAIRFTPILAVVFALLGGLTPSRETIYAIAASELGEEALKSSAATKAQQALNAWLDKQIEKPEQP